MPKNAKQEIEISIVTPMHNEEGCVREFHSRISAALNEMNTTFEILLINDGSADRTENIIRELSLSDPNLKGIMLARNRGQCTAIYAGIQESKGKYVVIMDGDLQHKPEEIPSLIEEIRKGYDLVSGCRTNRGESMIKRKLPSKIANYLMRATSGCQVQDMGGLSILKGKLARSMTLREGQHRLIPALVYSMGGSVSEVPISAPPRFAGKSHYGIGRSIDVLFDIVMLWFQSSFKQRPIYLFGRISLLMFMVASLIMVWLLYGKVFFGEHMGTRPPFMGAILLYLSSLGFMSTGFILESLANTYEAVMGTKTYQIRETISQSVADIPEKKDK